MKQYIQAYKFGISDAIAYRMRMVIWFLQSTMWICILPFIWLNIFGAQESIAGFTKVMLLTYFFFVPLIEGLTYHHVDYNIQQEIRDGQIVNFIIKPVKYLIYHFFVEMGYKTIGLFPPIITMLVIYPFVKNFISLPDFSLYILWVIPVIVLGSLVGFLISGIIGLVAFWTTRAEWAMHLWWMLSTFVGGFVAPLEFFPVGAQKLISYTPFPLLINTPISILLGSITTEQIIHQIILGTVWVAALFLITSFMYKRGIRRIEGIGI